MKRLVLAAISFLLLTGVAHAGEYNISFWKKTGTTNTFISMLNPTSVGAIVEVTFKSNTGAVIYSETKSISSGSAWYFDSKDKPFNEGFGTINIFVNDSINRQVPLAITAMLYGDINNALQVWNY